jgi:hypothetical protein
MNNLSFFSVFGSTAPIIYLLVILDLILKGITLFKSAKRDQRVWFVALLLINSLGILPIIYLIVNKDIKMTGTQKKVAVKTSKKSRR